MMLRKLGLAIVLILGCQFSTYSQDIEIDGLLLDRTISRLGHEFYYKFSALYRELPNTQGTNVVIKETLVPRAGTRLEVLLNAKVVYVTYMGRRQGPLQQRVEDALFTLMDAKAQAEFEAASEDMAASGW